MRYTQHFSTKQTPQSEAIPGKKMVPNSAGGYAFAISDWQRLDRFLFLGTEGGSYYATERKLTVENAQATLRCIEENGQRVVDRVVEVSHGGKAAKNDPALFVLALCASMGDEPTRHHALTSLFLVARIGTHLFHFAEACSSLRGWGRGLRSAIANWYLQQPPAHLAYEAMKYQQRDGWSHRDLLRLAHPKTVDEAQKLVFEWVCRGTTKLPSLEELPPALAPIVSFELAKTADERTLAGLVTRYNLPLEAIPPDKRTPEVWESVLPNLGLTALIRNLGNLSKIGLLAKGHWDTVKIVTERLTDIEQLKKGRIHPIAVLAALITYQSGHGARGHGEWAVVPEIVDALDTAFYRSFAAVEPTGKRIVLALDVSGSMGWGEVAGVPGLTPRIASAALAMVTHKTEQNIALVAFSQSMVSIDIGRLTRLDDVVKHIGKIPMGGTDCALPMLWALEKKVETDCFVILTDSETWVGGIHPVQALQQYRRTTGISAKLIVVGIVSNGFTIADPNDGGMLDVVGMSTDTPHALSQFIME